MFSVLRSTLIQQAMRFSNRSKPYWNVVARRKVVVRYPEPWLGVCDAMPSALLIMFQCLSSIISELNLFHSLNLTSEETCTE